jgi:hypothetical protein
LSDPICAKGIFDVSIDYFQRPVAAYVIQYHQRKPRITLAQKLDRCPAFAAEPPNRDAAGAELSCNHRAWL